MLDDSIANGNRLYSERMATRMLLTRCLRASGTLFARQGLTRPAPAVAARLQPTSASSFSSLASVIEQEVADETVGYQDTLDQLEDLRGQARDRSMELTESKGGAELRWGGEAEGSSVTVKFHCQVET